MTRRPRVSLVMPAYNAAATIGAALSSVLAQTLADVETVIVDDGSTDATVDIARAVAPGATIVRQPNAGVGAARAAGIAAARGELIAFCDADDLLFDRHLEALYAVWTERGNGGIATANAYWWLPGGIDVRKLRHRGRFPPPAEQRRAILASNFLSTMSMFPRTMVDHVGSFDPTLRQGEDWEFWIRAVLAGYPVVHQPRPLALYRWSVDGLSARAESFRAAEHEILTRVAARPDLTDSERAWVGRRLAAPTPNDLAGQGDRALRVGQYRAAARLYGAAAELIPDETPLVRKARIMRPVPWLVGPVLRRRQLAREARLGMDERHDR
ncbi:MAG TPA: glycosyltransferase [Mycobacteriales bacterium]|nr:glycosyltransferase [Mycobacteriales bacterium]